MAENETDIPAKDLIKQLNELAREASNRIIKSFEESAKKAGDLSHHLDAIVKSSKNLPKHIKSGSDLQKEMLSDADLFSKIQEKVLKNQKNSLSEYWNKVEKKLKKELSYVQDIKEKRKLELKVRKNIHDISEDSVELLQFQLKSIESQIEASNEYSTVLKGIGMIVGGTLLAAWTKLGDMAGKFFDALLAGDFKSAIDSITAPIQDLLSNIPLIGGILGGAFKLLKASFFELWDYIEQRVLPTNKMLVQQFGNIGGELKNLKSSAIGMGNTFEVMGLGFDKGRDAVVNFASSLQTTDFDIFGMSMKEISVLGVKLQEVIGLNAKSAADLALSFDRSDSSLAILNTTMAQAEVIAKQFGVIPNQIRKDMGENIDIVQRFGIANRMQFLESASVARQYGLSIKEVNEAFGQQLDTFDNTADVAAKLNTIFGTNINSLKLMLETDPTKRMAMLSKELLKNGQSWSKLNVFQKNVVKSTLNVDDATGALILSEKNLNRSQDAVIRKIKERENAQAIQQQATERWNKSIGSLQVTLLNFKEETGRVLRAVAELTARFLGFDSAQQGVTSTAKLVKDILRKIEKGIKSFSAQINPAEDNLTRFKNVFMKLFDTVGLISTSILEFKDTWDSVFSPLQSRKADKMVYTFLEGGKLLREENKKFLDELKDPELKKMLERKLKLSGLSTTEIEKGFETIEKRAFSQPKFIIPKFAQQKQDMNFKGNNLNLNKTSVDDAIVTKTGKIIELNPNDNIFATQAPIQEIIPKISSPATAILKDLTKTINKLNSFPAVQTKNMDKQPEIKIEVIDVNLDGRKIGEAQVRISRF